MASKANLFGFLVIAAIGCRGGDDDLLGPRVRTSAALVRYPSCDELARELRANWKERMRVQLLAYGGYHRSPEAVTFAETNDRSRQEGVDFSGTNNQEAGVDEADLVKTDGEAIYVLSGSHLEILGVPEVGELAREATVDIEGRPTQMLLDEGFVAVFSTLYPVALPDEHPLATARQRPTGDGLWYPFAPITKLTVVDARTRTAPRIARELYLEGWYQTARNVGATVRVVSHAHIEVPRLRYAPELPDGYWIRSDAGGDEILREAIRAAIAHNDAVVASTPLADMIPAVFERHADGTVTRRPFTDGDCASFAGAEDGMGVDLTSILSLDLRAADLPFEADHIVSNWSTVYASLDTLLIAEPAQDWWWYWGSDEFEDATNIHRFDISAPGVTLYTGSGRVPGRVHNQFALSEHQGFVRAASTTGERWWWRQEDAAPMENHVFVLAGEESLEQTGHLGGIATGERLWSSRFVADRAYLVTFRNIDPLWTIDLADPTAPRLIGELQVPGVSTYIHPLDESSLLTIGFGGDDVGLTWTTEVSLFDVGDFAHPAITSRLSLTPPSPSDGWSYAWSEATYEHKAFQYWAPLSLLAVPLSTYRWISVPCTDPGWYSCHRYEYSTKLELVSVDATAGLQRFGSIDHSPFYNTAGDVFWYDRDIRRSIFMHDDARGDFVYAVSDRAVTAHRLPDLSLVASIELPGTPNVYP